MRGPEERVLGAAAEDPVVPAPALEDVVTRVSGQPVVELRADDVLDRREVVTSMLISVTVGPGRLGGTESGPESCAAASRSPGESTVACSTPRPRSLAGRTPSFLRSLRPGKQPGFEIRIVSQPGIACRFDIELGVDAQRRENPMQGGASNGVLSRATLAW